MKKNRQKRLDDLLNRIRMASSTSLEELSQYFGVSTATIRRDIKFLEQEQTVVQTKGGVLYRQNRERTPQRRDPRVSFIEEKIRIAEYCTELVEEHDEIIVGPGTTTFLVGRIFSGIDDRRFRIITNSLELALETSGISNIETVILGGEVYERHSSGFTAHDDYFSTCHQQHKLLLSADGIDLKRGLTLFDPRFLMVFKKMIAVSSTVILATDSSKIGKVYFNKIADLEVISIVVTDTDAPARFCRELEDRGISVITV